MAGKSGRGKTPRSRENPRFPSICRGVITHSVDGRNPAPVDMVNIPLFTRFYICQVVQDFFHQQYFGGLETFMFHGFGVQR